MLDVLAWVSHEVEVKLSAGAVSSEGLTGAGEAASKVAPYMSAGGRLQFLTASAGGSGSLLQDLTTGLLESPPNMAATSLK